MSSRIGPNGRERASIARWKCEAEGLHHPDCPGQRGPDTGAWVIHHVYRRGHTPPGVDRNAVSNLRYVWNGATGMGAGGCHKTLHDNPTRAAELGLLHVDRAAYCKQCGGTTTHWKGCVNAGS